MTNIKIVKKNDLINLIEVKGHSGYEEIGKDIVCASVSSIVTTTVNAIIRFDESSINYKVDEGYMFIEIIKHDKYTDILLENMVSLLKELETKYKKNVKLNI